MSKENCIEWVKEIFDIINIDHNTGSLIEYDDRIHARFNKNLYNTLYFNSNGKKDNSDGKSFRKSIKNNEALTVITASNRINRILQTANSKNLEEIVKEIIKKIDDKLIQEQRNKVEKELAAFNNIIYNDGYCKCKKNNVKFRIAINA